MINSNNPDYEVVNKNLVANIMKHFSPEFITSIIDEQYSLRDKLMLTTPQNIIELLETNYINVIQQSRLQELYDNRNETYQNIIMKMAQYNGIRINTFMLTESDIDLYRAAHLMYNLLILNYRNYLISFMSTFIMSEINNLYNVANLISYKKDKDVTSTTLKKQYDSKKLPLIVSKLDVVIQSIPYNYTITLGKIIQTVMPEMQADINVLASIIEDENNFFMNNYVRSMLSNEFRNDILVDLKLELNRRINLIEKQQQQGEL